MPGKPANRSTASNESFLVGILSILMGLVAEMLVRTYFESQGRSAYLVRELVNFASES